MDNMWVTIVKATGLGGIVGFLIYYVLKHIFSEQIIKLFGSDKLFALTVMIIATLLIILLVAIFKSQEKSQSSHQSAGAKVTYSGNSTHNGDNNF